MPLLLTTAAAAALDCAVADPACTSPDEAAVIVMVENSTDCVAVTTVTVVAEATVESELVKLTWLEVAEVADVLLLV